MSGTRTPYTHDDSRKDLRRARSRVAAFVGLLAAAAFLALLLSIYLVTVTGAG